MYSRYQSFTLCKLLPASWDTDELTKRENLEEQNFKRKSFHMDTDKSAPMMMMVHHSTIQTVNVNHWLEQWLELPIAVVYRR